MPSGVVLTVCVAVMEDVCDIDGVRLGDCELLCEKLGLCDCDGDWVIVNDCNCEGDCVGLCVTLVVCDEDNEPV